MRFWLWPIVYACAGCLLLACGWLVPAHLRAVDVNVVVRAGRQTPSLIEEGLVRVRDQKLGAAEMVLQAAKATDLPDQARLASAVRNLAQAAPGSPIWGGPEPRLQQLFGPEASPRQANAEPFTSYVIRVKNRERFLEFLRRLPDPLVRELLHCRALTNTVVFPPSNSAAGQAFDAAIAVAGLLQEGGHLSPALRARLTTLAAEANYTGDPERLEEVLLDLISLGQRFNWDQTVEFVRAIEDTETLARLADQVRAAESDLPILFVAVLLTGQPARVAHYLLEFSRTGMRDLRDSLRFGAGGLMELVKRGQGLYRPRLRQRLVQYQPVAGLFSVAADVCWRAPWLGLAGKWLLYLGGGMLLGAAVQVAKATPRARDLRPGPGFELARSLLFALGFLVVVVLVSEPFLTQESQRQERPLRLRLPVAGGAGPTGKPSTPARMIMNHASLLTLVLFFVLQGLLYAASLTKLAEIRRQNLPPRIKLKLLENEDHLFDAGLYLGFVGTIISLIFVSLGVIKPSLMAAYSSTSFGIIFVSIFKIFHLRTLRRILLLESEAVDAGSPATAAASPTPATPS